jgi:hypothetical protein
MSVFLSSLTRRELTFVPEFSYVVTEHDPDQPWLALGQGRHKVTLEDGVDFFTWAHEHWPSPRWSFELDRYQLSPMARPQ